MQKPQAIATWSPERDLWETSQADIFGHSVAYSATLPKSGMTRSGQLYELPTSVPLTTGPASSSPRCLPTPLASDGEKERNNPSQARRKSPPLSAVSHLLPQTSVPTPKQSNGGSG